MGCRLGVVEVELGDPVDVLEDPGSSEDIRSTSSSLRRRRARRATCRTCSRSITRADIRMALRQDARRDRQSASSSSTCGCSRPVRGRRAPLHRHAGRRPRRDLRPRRRHRQLHPGAGDDRAVLARARLRLHGRDHRDLPRRPGRRRPLPAADAGPRGRQDRLLAHLARLLPLRRRRLRLPAQLPRRRLAGAALALALVARRAGSGARPAPG